VIHIHTPHHHYTETTPPPTAAAGPRGYISSPLFAFNLLPALRSVRMTDTGVSHSGGNGGSLGSCGRYARHCD